MTGHRSVADLRGTVADHQCITKKGLTTASSNYALFLEADQSRFRNDLIEGYSLIELPGSENSGLYVGIFTEILRAASNGQVAIETVMSMASSQLSRISRTPAIEYLEDGTLIFGSGRRDFFTEEQLPPEATDMENVVQQQLKEKFSWQTALTADEERDTVKIDLTE